MKLKPVYAQRLLCAFAAALLLGTTSMPEMLRDESRRSLGDGRLATLLSSPDTQTAARAALAIGRSKQPDGAKLLELHTNDRRAPVRAFSIYGLGLIGLGTDATGIIAHAENDRSGAVRIAALDAIARYEDAHRLNPALESQAALAVERVLASGADAAIRGRAALTLAAFANGPSAAGAAASLQAATAPSVTVEVRRRAMWTIFRDYAKAVPRALLQSRLRDRDEIVRIEAVRAYGRLAGTPSAIADLRPLLSDPSWRVQEQTAESIRVLGGGAMTDHLKEIPAYVHIPPPQPDPLAALPALPRQPVHAGAPRVADVPPAPALAPHTAEEMLSPARGPHPRLRLRTTEGNIYVVLYPEWAPLTVTNFLNLVNRGFFDDNQWFRIVPDFVVQTGEKDAIKAPGPGYTIDAEENPLEQNSYVISMGLDYNMKTMTPKRDSAGSEYYITLSPQYHLDEAFTVFGAVSSGFDVLARLTEHDRVIRVDRIEDAML